MSTSHAADQPRVGLALALFFCSGASGLIFEVVWVRLLALVFGSTTHAVATILAAYMAGLGLGAWIAGGLAARQRRPLQLYCAIEAGVGVLGIGLTALLFHADALAPLVYGLAAGSAPLSTLLVAVISLALVACPVGLMGATLPLLMAGLSRPGAAVLDRVSWLYGANTAGAVLGCLLADFALIPLLGVFETALCAGAVNLLVALIGLRGFAAAGVGPAVLAPARPTVVHPLGRWTWLVGAAAIGAASFAIEVLFTRMLLLFTGARISAFSIMLATVLLGIAAGSLIIAPRIRPPGLPAHSARARLAALLALAALAVLGSLWLCFQMVTTILPALAALHPALQLDATPTQVITSGLLLLLPSTLLGAAFPVFVAEYRQHASDDPRALAAIYLANTSGCIAGSLLAGFVLLPVAGIQIGVLLVAVEIGVVAVVVLLRAPRPEGRAPAVAIGRTLVAALVLALGSTAALPSDYLARQTYRHVATPPHERVLEVREGVNETIAILERQQLGVTLYRALYTNSHSMSSTSWVSQRYMRLMAHLPALLQRSPPQRALLICFGVGVALSALNRHDSLDSIQVVEISREILELHHYFHAAGEDPLADPRVQLEVGDGRHYLVTHSETYDLITAEPPPPTFRGVVNLYSKEFYQRCRDRLSPEGLMSQWLPTFQVPLWETLTMIRAFVEVFPDATLWHGEGPQMILVGGRRPVQVDVEMLAQRLLDGPVADDLRRIGVVSAHDLLAQLALAPAELRALTKGIPPCTDNEPTIEYAAAQSTDYDFVMQLTTTFGAIDPLVLRWGQTDLAADQQRRGVARARQVVRDTRPLILEGLDFDPVRNDWVRSARMVPPALTVLPDSRYLRALLGVERELVAAAHSRLAVDPDHREALLLVGKEAYLTGAYDIARRHFERYLERYPGDAEVEYLLAFARQELARLPSSAPVQDGGEGGPPFSGP